ncbi:MAG: glucose-6-phosphate dehydrogenase [Prolixibacteraceae bacterium]|jgi:glucose-6-phosphate 1-dehydrogenase|nr:glucose-6-phosphate dehydrogenase [Prolixibacteraceae bacterium]
MKRTQPHILVIFGASGDLTKRKLIPAVYNLHQKELLSHPFAILGVSRTKMNDEEFREKMREFLPNDDTTSDFISHLHYQSLQTTEEDEYEKLKTRIDDLRKQLDAPGNIVFYMSTPPSMYHKIPGYLAGVGLNNENDGFKRLIIEKPFGVNLETARELNKDLLKYFKEEQLYRIDHYLGKETVQNLMVLRFANSLWEPLWNHKYIDHIQITSAESLGVESRGGYYDESGAMRDMLQNHLMQLIGLVAMEPPTIIDADAIRNEMLKVFQSLRPLKREDLKDNIVRGQYTSSNIKGNEVPGYREEKGVNDNSRTETFVALKLHIDNWRWAGIPFYIRTGKKMPTRATEIVINFRPMPHHLFDTMASSISKPNQLIIRIQPDEGLLLKMGLKEPGTGFNVQPVNLRFHYSDLSDAYVPTAYERLLLDCIQGDATLYARGDNVEKAWEFVQPILDEWEKNPEFPLNGYPAGTWGPHESEKLIANEVNGWRYPCKNLAKDGEYCEL